MERQTESLSFFSSSLPEEVMDGEAAAAGWRELAREASLPAERVLAIGMDAAMIYCARALTAVLAMRPVGSRADSQSAPHRAGEKAGE